MGYGADCDEELRASLIATVGSALLDESSNEVADAVFIWYRDGDGDLADYLMDGLTYLTDHGSLWLLNPKFGRPGHIEASEITDAVAASGLSQSNSFPLSQNWIATKVVIRKNKR
jgi:hypothetical protein